VNSSALSALCVGAHNCVPVRAHVPWCVCVIVHACACVPVSRTACMMRRMQPRAYKGVGAGVGVGVGEGVGVGVGEGVGLHAQTACSMLPLNVRTALRYSQRRPASVPARMWTSIGAAPAQSRRRCEQLGHIMREGAHNCVLLRARARAHVPWCVCVIVHACACEPVSPQCE
jgi:hypothetical protein